MLKEKYNKCNDDTKYKCKDISLKLPELDEVEDYIIKFAQNDINNLGPLLTGAQQAYDFIVRRLKM